MKTAHFTQLSDTIRKSDKINWDTFIKSHGRKQQSFLNCKHHSIFFLGAKRSGKTLGATSRVLLADQLGVRGPRIVLAGANLEKIRSLYWNNLWVANKHFGLGWQFRSGSNLIETKNRQIVFRSLRDIANADKDTGFEVLMAVIEEAHQVRVKILIYYIDNIIRVNFLNVPGACLCLILNPPVYPLPTFEKRFYLNQEYKKFHITPAENPSISKETLKKFMLQEAKVLGFNTIAEARKNSNAFRRNIYGEWITDKGRIIIEKEKVQYFDELPKEKLEYVIGVDIGGGKAKDAIVIIAYHKYERKAWVVEEEEYDTENEDIEFLATHLKRFYDIYKPHNIAIDTGGVGNRIAGVLRYRYGVPSVSPAIKQDKMAHLEEMKAEIHQGRLLFKEDSPLVDEFPQIIYNEDRSEIDDENGLHSDLLDACLYAMRDVFNAWPKEKPVKKTYSQERIEAILRKKNKRTKIGY